MPHLAAPSVAEILRASRLLALVSLLSLIALCLVWELWIAPLRPGGSFFALKALPLVLPLAGIMKGRRYTFQWSSLLILGYLAEGVTRAWSDSGASAELAFAEACLSAGFFAAVVTYSRLSRSA